MAVTNILCQTKRYFAFSKIGFCAGTKGSEEALNTFKFSGLAERMPQAERNILIEIKI